MIDIEAQHGGEQVVKTLAGSVLIGSAGAVASGDVEKTIRTDDSLAAVMAAGGPFDAADYCPAPTESARRGAVAGP